MQNGLSQKLSVFVSAENNQVFAKRYFPFSMILVVRKDMVQFVPSKAKVQQKNPEIGSIRSESVVLRRRKSSFNSRNVF